MKSYGDPFFVFEKQVLINPDPKHTRNPFTLRGNVPGSYHQGAANLSFADSHIERHKWLVPQTVRAVIGARIDAFPASPRTDFEWLKERTSEKK